MSKLCTAQNYATWVTVRYNKIIDIVAKLK